MFFFQLSAGEISHSKFNIYILNSCTHIFQIDCYEDLYVEIEQMQTIQVFSKWLRVDARAFKQGLLNVIKRWSLMFKQHLIDRVTGG